MIIKNFNFKYTKLNNLDINYFIKQANIFGLDFITEFMIYIITNQISTHHLVLNKEDKRYLYQLLDIRISKQPQYWKNQLYIEFLEESVKHFDSIIANENLNKFLLDLINALLASKLKFLPKFDLDKNFKIRQYYKYTSPGIGIDDYLFINNYSSFCMHKLRHLLRKKFNYIFIKDNSAFEKNWYSYETLTREKVPQKYVIPFYRNLARPIMSFHILLELELPITSNKYSAYWTYNHATYYIPPKKYNFLSMDIADKIRQQLQKSDKFYINNNYEKFNDYYFYKGHFIDLNFSLYRLNKKWLAEAKIIKQYKKS